MEETYDGVIGVSAKVGIKEELSASLPLVLSKPTTNLKITCPSLDGETIHSDDCVLKAPKVFRDAFTGLNVMRLIDVSQNSLVDVQVLRQYVALSYIWGAVPNFRLTTSNRNQLLLQGSIDKIWGMFPRTIQDAITLVRKLELYCLWVDALCL
jgi:hypothetical protein